MFRHLYGNKLDCSISKRKQAKFSEYPEGQHDGPVDIQSEQRFIFRSPARNVAIRRHPDENELHCH